MYSDVLRLICTDFTPNELLLIRVILYNHLRGLKRPRLKPNSSVFGLTEYYSANS